jgi:hypothetical protein
MSYSGKYTPQNPEKYKGNLNNIIYRSNWERNCMKLFDHNSNVLAWASEELPIPYISPIDRKIHKYFPDFIVKVLDKNKEEKKYIIEVKPQKQTEPPKVPKRKTKTYFKALQTYATNISKWKYAKEWCDKHNYIFKILTEKDCT